MRLVAVAGCFTGKQTIELQYHMNLLVVQAHGIEVTHQVIGTIYA